MLQVTTIGSPLRLAVSDIASEPEAAVLARVDRIWEREGQQRGGTLFNGSIFSVDRRAGAAIEGHFVEYKRFLAQLRDPTLYPALQIRSLAVSGLLESRDGIVFGLRGAEASQDGGRWELVPSGGIDRRCLDADGTLSCARQLLLELEEELGLAPDEVLPPRSFVLVEDPDSHVIDIGLHITTGLGRDEITARFRSLAQPEYARLEIVPRATLADFVAERGTALVAVSRVLLDTAVGPTKAAAGAAC